MTKKITKLGVLFLFLAVLSTPALAATSGLDFEFNEAIVQAIVNLTILSVGLSAAIQALKEWLKLEDGWAIALSGFVAYIFTGVYLLTAGIFTWLAFGVYGFMVFAEVNGFYKYARPILLVLLEILKEKKK